MGQQPDESGNELLEKVIALTGLPEADIKEELLNIVKAAGHEDARLTLDQLRKAMLSYLESCQKELLGEQLPQGYTEEA